MRGVGDPGTTAITNPAVALNVGGVYYAPALNLEAGNYALIASDGAVNLPLGSNAAMRVSYQIRHRDGYLSDGSNDDIRQAARLQFLFEPSSAFSIALLGSYAHQGGVGNGYALYDPAGNPASTPRRAPTAPFDPWTAITDPRGAAISATTAPPPILLPGNANNLYQNNDFWNAQAEITADVGFAKLTVIPSYQYAKLDYRGFAALDYATRDGAGVGQPENSKAYSTEARLSNEGRLLKWVVGAFYYNENQRFANTLNNGFIQFVSISAKIKTESVAAFGQATLSLADSFRVIGGLRYTDDTRSLAGTRVDNLPVPGSNPNPIGGRVHSNRLDYKAGFEFNL
eukprot:gene21208-22016_t